MGEGVVWRRSLTILGPLGGAADRDPLNDPAREADGRVLDPMLQGGQRPVEDALDLAFLKKALPLRQITLKSRFNVISIKVASGSEVRVGTSALASTLIAPPARWPRSGLRFREHGTVTGRRGTFKATNLKQRLATETAGLRCSLSRQSELQRRRSVRSGSEFFRWPQTDGAFSSQYFERYK